MKTKILPVVLSFSAALLFSSCYVPYAGGAYSPYGAPAVASPGGYVDEIDPSLAWYEASYDSAGYPIYGYAYGRPIYGYTPAGVAIYSYATLTSLCYIPDWGPASWYRGPSWHARGRRYSNPPRHSAGHRPSARPSSHGPSHSPSHSPSHKTSYKPSGGNHKPSVKPSVKPSGGGNHKPSVKPSGGSHKPSGGSSHTISGAHQQGTSHNRH